MSATGVVVPTPIRPDCKTDNPEAPATVNPPANVEVAVASSA
jgi:hypothetical protein